MSVPGRIRLMFRLAIRARLAKKNPGSTGIVGLTGIAQTAIAPNGTVFVRGELWPAHSTASIAPGQTVRVAGVNGISLDVDSILHNQATESR